MTITMATAGTDLPPEAVTLGARGRVVVGLRGAVDAADALAVGFAEAQRRGTELAVTVIRDDRSADICGDGLAPAFRASEESDLAEADQLSAAVAAAGSAFPTIRVRTSMRTGPFSDVLIDLSRSADLVVLGMGRRPTGVGRSDLLVATHADCPVIVVRERSGKDA
jgi:nucleotide-binding universal stress UspA family protein